jgi:hypothetical protein
MATQFPINKDKNRGRFLLNLTSMHNIVEQGKKTPLELKET